MSNTNNADRQILAETGEFQVRESYKIARTNIEYAIIKKGCKKIAVTSSEKGEGKTITSVNIATAFAQQVDTKVLIVDCDLRRPRVHSTLNIQPAPGLTNYLCDESPYENIIKKTSVDNLYAVCFGAIPPNPSELLSSGAMADFIDKVEKDYDYIIFDTPPVGVVVDSIPVIKKSDGVVLVVIDNKSTYPKFEKTVEILERADAKILGVIINKVKPKEAKKYGKYYYEYGYGY